MPEQVMTFVAIPETELQPEAETDRKILQSVLSNQTQQKPKRGRPKKNHEPNDQTESMGTTENSGNTRTRKGWQSVIRQQLNDLWGMVALAMVFVNDVDATIITERAPKITEAIIHIAEVKPEFRKFLLRTSEGALYVELIAAIAPICILIGVNHKVLPAFVAIPYGGLPKQDSDSDNASNIPFDISSIFRA